MLLQALVAAALVPRARALNVLDFGADPTGATDATAALQAALDAAARNTSASKGTTAAGAPVVIFPAGTYTVSDALDLSREAWPANKVTVTLRGDGLAAIVQTRSDSDIIVSSKAWRVTVTELKFVGGRHQLVLGNNNSDVGALRIEGCEFYESSGVAVYNVGPSCDQPSCPAPALVGSYSTQLVVRDCIFWHCDQALITWSKASGAATHDAFNAEI